MFVIFLLRAKIKMTPKPSVFLPPLKSSETMPCKCQDDGWAAFDFSLVLSPDRNQPAEPPTLWVPSLTGGRNEKAAPSQI